ncbi:MAG TPA: hypothetical protein VKV32_16065 [Stellaceae bacterium]|nr:hypothetical protein [Stellaceae bacterium]
MKRFYPLSMAGLLALAVGLAVTSPRAFALTRETPLEAAQRIEALTAGGLFDPAHPPATDPALASVPRAAPLLFPQKIDQRL